ncbi:MAG: hypothetical protein LBQ59_02805 [Candidatus Peribacteria bacterium]|nr:hypothetical protein [Candidatus Peribacteria bacterium]
MFTRSSDAKILPFPSLVLSKSCQITQIRESASCDFIWSFSSQGNISTILETVLAAQEVCKVAITKFQVSAALSANLKVSKSLISQIIITSLACLNAYFKPLSKLFVLFPTSLCSTIDNQFSKTYSIGSSTVITCLAIVVVTLDNKEAIVVDFQDPTAQVTKRSQFFLLIKSNNFSGNHNSSNNGIFVLIGLKIAQIQFFDINTFTLNLEYHFKSIEKSNSRFSSNILFCFSVIIQLISFFNPSAEKTSYSFK